MDSVAGSTHARSGTLTGKFLTLSLADRDYGVSIRKVREIIGMTDITVVPRMPPHVMGVISLRGKAIPVVDLRSVFRMARAAYTEQTCIVIVGPDPLIGVIVDAVREVFSIETEQIAPPQPGVGGDARFVTGTAKLDDRVRFLLDIDALLDMSIENDL